MKNFSLQDILRENVRNITPYSTARDDFQGVALVNLDANENSFGSVGGGNYNRYPDPYQSELKSVLSQIKNVPTDQIFVGNGSDEGIGLLYTAFCNPGKDNTIICPPSYGMYGVSADVSDTKRIEIPLTEDFQLQTDEILAATNANTKIIWICSPNNPSGNLIHRADILRILQASNCIVVVDEAYGDFSSDPSWTTELANFPNLVVLQTLSKAWGLANLRLGLLFASKEIIAVLNKIKMPYNINGMIQAYAIDILSKHAADKNFYVSRILSERERLIPALQSMPKVRKIYPSDANFLLVKIDNGHQVYTDLVNAGIIVRDRSKVLLCNDCLRITIGTPAENDLLVKTLKAILEK